MSLISKGHDAKFTPAVASRTNYSKCWPRWMHCTVVSRCRALAAPQALTCSYGTCSSNTSCGIYVNGAVMAILPVCTERPFRLRNALCTSVNASEACLCREMLNEIGMMLACVTIRRHGAILIQFAASLRHYYQRT